MITMQWTNDHSVGIPEIDKEHQAIFLGINALHDAIRRKARWSDVHALLIDLSEQVLMHFEVEVSLMQIHGYPDLARHAEQHRLYSARFQDLLQMSLIRNFTQNTLELDFLDSWWIEHIFMYDRAYADWFHTVCAGAVLVPACPT
jgi:hemerythrin-like metal-binding protein